MYEWMFLIWFVGACGMFAYDTTTNDADFNQCAISAATWPIVIGGLGFAFAFHYARRSVKWFAKAVR